MTPSARLRNLLLAMLLFIPTIAGAAGHEIAAPEISSYSAGRPVIASNGNVFLAAWLPWQHDRVDAMPYDATGHPDNPSALPLLRAAYAASVDVAASGSEYVAVVDDYGRRDTQIIVSDAKGVVIRTFALPIADIFEPRIAVTGHRIMVTGRSLAGVTAYFSDDRGSVVSSILIHPSSVPFAVTTFGDEFIVAVTGTDTPIHRFSSGGTPIGAPIGIGFRPSTIDVAAGDDTLAVVGSDASSQLLRSTLDRDGELRWTGLLARSDRFIESPKVVFAGGLFHVVYNETAQLPESKCRLSLVSFARGGDATAPIRLSEDSDSFALTSIATDGDVIVAVGDGPLTVTSIAWPINQPEARHIDTPAVHAVDQAEPAIATDGSEFLAVWAESGITNGRVVRATKLDRRGIAIDGTAPLIIGRGQLPAVAFGNDRYLIAWFGNGGISGVRVSQNGTPIDSEPFTIATPTGYYQTLSVAWNGAAFVVAWSESDGIHAETVGHDAMIGTAHRVSPATSSDGPTRTTYEDPIVACDPSTTRCVIAYRSARWTVDPLLPTAQDMHVDAVSVDGDATATNDPAAVAPTAAAFEVRHAIAHGIGDEFVVVLASDEGLFASTIQANSRITVERTSLVFDWPAAEIQPAIARRGNEYVAAWTYRTQSRRPYLAMAALDGYGNVRDLRVNASDTPWAFPGHALAIAANDFGDAVVVTSENTLSGSQRIVSYGRADLEPLPAPPPAPVILQFTRSEDGHLAVLSWSRTEPDERYIVTATYEDGSVDTFLDDENQATFSKVPSFATVRAFNAGGISPPSAPATPQLPQNRRRRATAH